MYGYMKDLGRTRKKVMTKIQKENHRRELILQLKTAIDKLFYQTIKIAVTYGPKTSST